MCNFFSFCSDGNGTVFYFNAEQRKQPHLNYSPDSHTSIADYYGFKGAKEDTLNKWEYNPLTDTLVCDQMNGADDFFRVLAWIRGLDFKTIIPELRIKSIINPLEIKRDIPGVSTEEKYLLEKWISVWDSVWDSVGNSARDSVWVSVRNSVWNSVWDSVWDSVGNSVWVSVRNSVRNSARDSVRNSARDSVWDSVWAYIGSFFDLPKWKYRGHPQDKYPFQCVVDLWEAGLVPSFNGKTWRLHAGPKAEIVFEMKC